MDLLDFDFVCLESGVVAWLGFDFAVVEALIDFVVVVAAVALLDFVVVEV